MTHFIRLLAIAIPSLMLTQTAAGQTEVTNDPEAARIQSVAEDAYVYGLPLVMTYGVMHAFSLDPTSSQYKAPMNHLQCFASLATPAEKPMAADIK